MLRDVPKVYLYLFLFLCMLALLIFWYTNNFQHGDNNLQLNDAALSVTVSEVDQTSRIYPGALILADTFEPALFKRLNEIYTKGDTVQIDYLFDSSDTRFSNVEQEKVSSPTYIIGGSGSDVPSASRVSYMTGRPLKAVRVNVHKQGDKVGKWTYTATITVDAASKAGH